MDEARKPKDPPFRIDIDSGTSLTDQMVRGFCEAILSVASPTLHQLSTTNYQGATK